MGRVQRLAIYPNVSTWIDDPLFNMAAHAFVSSIEEYDPTPTETNKEPSPHIFTSNLGNKTGLAAHVNAFLKPFGEKFGLNITSHSARHSSSDIASEHFQVYIFWIVQRGDWALDAINTFFEYLTWSSNNDRRVARALAGYSDVGRGEHLFSNPGGELPSLSCISDSALIAKLENLSQSLFEAPVKGATREKLFIVLIIQHILLPYSRSTLYRTRREICESRVLFRSLCANPRGNGR
jgi:hypothetical protein